MRPLPRCAICDSDLAEVRATSPEGRPVCDRCAQHIANTWSMAVSGEYITWPNPPRPKPAYKKRAIPKTIRTQVFERDAYRCKHCGSHKDLRADHIIPESKGGPTTVDNLQTLCVRCNSRKGTRDG